MTKWTIDAAGRKATSPKGQVHVMARGDDGAWYSAPASAKANAEWDGALQLGAASLRTVGESLFGDRWQLALAKMISIDENTIRHWLTGKNPFTLAHPIWPHIVASIRARVQADADLADQLERSLQRIQPAQSGRYAGSDRST